MGKIVVRLINSYDSDRDNFIPVRVGTSSLKQRAEFEQMELISDDFASMPPPFRYDPESKEFVLAFQNPHELKMITTEIDPDEMLSMKFKWLNQTRFFPSGLKISKTSQQRPVDGVFSTIQRSYKDTVAVYRCSCRLAELEEIFHHLRACGPDDTFVILVGIPYLTIPIYNHCLGKSRRAFVPPHDVLVHLVRQSEDIPRHAPVEITLHCEERAPLKVVVYSYDEWENWISERSDQLMPILESIDISEAEY